MLALIACLAAAGARADHDEDFSWALLHATGSTTGSGGQSDWQAMAKLREKGVRSGLYARLGSRRFVISDSTVRAEVAGLLEPQEAIEKQQEAVGRDMDRLEKERAAMEARRDELERREDRITDDIARLEMDRSRLGSSASDQRQRQDYDRRILAARTEREKVTASLHELRPRMSYFENEDARLSRHQDALDREQDRVAKAAEREIREVITQAIDRGLGRPFPG
jgi:chromosome segregation ATPase